MNLLVLLLVVLVVQWSSYRVGRQDGYQRGYSDAWWRARGEPTMDEWEPDGPVV